jgi:predicted esterase
MVERTAQTQDHGQCRRTRTGGHQSLVSPRGKVLENGMPRFFRRLVEGVFDIADLTRRAKEVVHFIAAFRVERKLRDNRSNGANIAVSLLLLHPSSPFGAVLFRVMVPFQPDSRPDLNDTWAFMSLRTARPDRSTGKRSRTRADLQGRRRGCFSALGARWSSIGTGGYRNCWEMAS